MKKTIQNFRSIYAAPILKTVAVFGLALLLLSSSFVRADKPDVQNVESSRQSAVTLKTPQNNDSFTFLIFADRTHGTPEGIAVLKEAVIDANRLAPDFVMNIGDMIQGYNTTEQWLEEMKEYRSVMNGLKCPWYPTAGNHDIYAGQHAKDLPKGQREKEYEEHFGPLWYAFEHKNYWFIVLFTDEGDPKTGEKNFSKPKCQTMSDTQFNWLQSILKKAKNADGIFVFQHQPRWLKENYGDDWDKVHTAFVETGNVKAVFAGHIHRMTYNEKDGIKYITLATTGGNLGRIDPAAGFVHEIHHVSLRKNAAPKITVLPVGSTLDITKMPSGQRNETPSAKPKRNDTDPKTESEKTPRGIAP
ncbi:MAG: metallophosphoesterase [Planctomycetaceae bacterium]|jgi:hypothetical protein|nr:metallophosphoesterase [Planctomycetaceae bacterium]